MPLGASRFGFTLTGLGGSLELIQSQTVSSVSSIAFTSIKESVYDVHFLQISNFQQDHGSSTGMRWLL